MAASCLAGADECIAAAAAAAAVSGGGGGGATGDGGEFDHPPQPPRLRLPPLPLLSELESLQGFVFSSLDDAAEDAVKLLFVWLAYRLVSACLRLCCARLTGSGTSSASPRGAARRRRGVSSALVRRYVAVLITAAAILLLYVPVNEFSDSVGNVAQIAQDWLSLTFGAIPKAPPPAASPRPPPACAAADLVDDVTEDAMKLACVGTHAALGGFVGSGVAAALLQWVFGAVGLPPHAAAAVALERAVVTVFVLGTPASKYTACNDWADELGDATQAFAMQFVC